MLLSTRGRVLLLLLCCQAFSAYVDMAPRLTYWSVYNKPGFASSDPKPVNRNFYLERSPNQPSAFSLRRGTSFSVPITNGGYDIHTSYPESKFRAGGAPFYRYPYYRKPDQFSRPEPKVALPETVASPSSSDSSVPFPAFLQKETSEVIQDGGPQMMEKMIAVDEDQYRRQHTPRRVSVINRRPVGGFSPWRGKRSLPLTRKPLGGFSPWRGKRSLPVAESQRGFTINPGLSLVSAQNQTPLLNHATTSQDSGTMQRAATKHRSVKRRWQITRPRYYRVIVSKQVQQRFAKPKCCRGRNTPKKVLAQNKVGKILAKAQRRPSSVRSNAIAAIQDDTIHQFKPTYRPVAPLVSHPPRPVVPLVSHPPRPVAPISHPPNTLQSSPLKLLQILPKHLLQLVHKHLSTTNNKLERLKKSLYVLAEKMKSASQSSSLPGRGAERTPNQQKRGYDDNQQLTAPGDLQDGTENTLEESNTLRNHVPGQQNTAAVLSTDGLGFTSQMMNNPDSTPEMTDTPGQTPQISLTDFIKDLDQPTLMKLLDNPDMQLQGLSDEDAQLLYAVLEELLIEENAEENYQAMMSQAGPHEMIADPSQPGLGHFFAEEPLPGSNQRMNPQTPMHGDRETDIGSMPESFSDVLDGNKPFMYAENVPEQFKTGNIPRQPLKGIRDDAFLDGSQNLHEPFMYAGPEQFKAGNFPRQPLQNFPDDAFPGTVDFSQGGVSPLFWKEPLEEQAEPDLPAHSGDFDTQRFGAQGFGTQGSYGPWGSKAYPTAGRRFLNDESIPLYLKDASHGKSWEDLHWVDKPSGKSSIQYEDRFRVDGKYPEQTDGMVNSGMYADTVGGPYGMTPLTDPYRQSGMRPFVYDRTRQNNPAIHKGLSEYDQKPFNYPSYLKSDGLSKEQKNEYTLQPSGFDGFVNDASENRVEAYGSTQGGVGPSFWGEPFEQAKPEITMQTTAKENVMRPSNSQVIGNVEPIAIQNPVIQQDAQIPMLKDAPAFQRGGSVIQNDAPITVINDAPAFQRAGALNDDAPAFQNDDPIITQTNAPAFQRGGLAIQNDASAFQNDDPIKTENDAPAFQRGRPVIQNDAPAFQRGGLAIQNDAPAFQSDDAMYAVQHDSPMSDTNDEKFQDMTLFDDSNDRSIIPDTEDKNYYFFHNNDDDYSWYSSNPWNIKYFPWYDPHPWSLGKRSVRSHRSVRVPAEQSHLRTLQNTTPLFRAAQNTNSDLVQASTLFQSPPRKFYQSNPPTWHSRYDNGYSKHRAYTLNKNFRPRLPPSLNSDFHGLPKPKVTKQTSYIAPGLTGRQTFAMPRMNNFLQQGFNAGGQSHGSRGVNEYSVASKIPKLQPSNAGTLSSPEQAMDMDITFQTFNQGTKTDNTKADNDGAASRTSQDNTVIETAKDGAARRTSEDDTVTETAKDGAASRTIQDDTEIAKVGAATRTTGNDTTKDDAVVAMNGLFASDGSAFPNEIISSVSGSEFLSSQGEVLENTKYGQKVTRYREFALLSPEKNLLLSVDGQGGINVETVNKSGNEGSNDNSTDGSDHSSIEDEQMIDEMKKKMMNRRHADNNVEGVFTANETTAVKDNDDDDSNEDDQNGHNSNKTTTIKDNTTTSNDNKNNSAKNANNTREVEKDAILDEDLDSERVGSPHDDSRPKTQEHHLSKRAKRSTYQVGRFAKFKSNDHKADTQDESSDKHEKEQSARFKFDDNEPETQREASYENEKVNLNQAAKNSAKQLREDLSKTTEENSRPLMMTNPGGVKSEPGMAEFSRPGDENDNEAHTDMLVNIHGLHSFLDNKDKDKDHMPAGMKTGFGLSQFLRAKIFDTFLNDYFNSSNEKRGKFSVGDTLGKSYGDDTLGRSYAGEKLGKSYAGENLGKFHAGETIGKSSVDEQIGKSYAGDTLDKNSADENFGKSYAGDTLDKNSADENLGKSYASYTLDKNSADENLGKSYAGDTLDKNSADENLGKSYAGDTLDKNSADENLGKSNTDETHWANKNRGNVGEGEPKFRAENSREDYHDHGSQDRGLPSLYASLLTIAEKITSNENQGLENQPGTRFLEDHKSKRRNSSNEDGDDNDDNNNDDDHEDSNNNHNHRHTDSLNIVDLNRHMDRMDIVNLFDFLHPGQDIHDINSGRPVKSAPNKGIADTGGSPKVGTGTVNLNSHMDPSDIVNLFDFLYPSEDIEDDINSGRPSKSGLPNKGTSNSARSNMGTSKTARSPYMGTPRTARSNMGTPRTARSNMGTPSTARSKMGTSNRARSNMGTSNTVRSNVGTSNTARSPNMGTPSTARSNMGTSNTAISSNMGTANTAKSSTFNLPLSMIPSQGSTRDTAEGVVKSAANKRRRHHKRRLHRRQSPLKQHADREEGIERLRFGAGTLDASKGIYQTQTDGLRNKDTRTKIIIQIDHNNSNNNNGNNKSDASSKISTQLDANNNNNKSDASSEISTQMDANTNNSNNKRDASSKISTQMDANTNNNNDKRVSRKKRQAGTAPGRLLYNSDRSRAVPGEPSVYMENIPEQLPDDAEHGESLWSGRNLGYKIRPGHSPGSWSRGGNMRAEDTDNTENSSGQSLDSWSRGGNMRAEDTDNTGYRATEYRLTPDKRYSGFQSSSGLGGNGIVREAKYRQTQEKRFSGLHSLFWQGRIGMGFGSPEVQKGYSDFQSSRGQGGDRMVFNSPAVQKGYSGFHSSARQGRNGMMFSKPALEKRAFPSSGQSGNGLMFRRAFSLHYLQPSLARPHSNKNGYGGRARYNNKRYIVFDSDQVKLDSNQGELDPTQGELDSNQANLAAMVSEPLLEPVTSERLLNEEDIHHNVNRVLELFKIYNLLTPTSYGKSQNKDASSSNMASNMPSNMAASLGNNRRWPSIHYDRFQLGNVGFVKIHPHVPHRYTYRSNE